MSKTESVKELYAKHVMNTYANQKIALVRGRGTKVWDADGKVYLDFISGISVLNIGHCHPNVVKAIQEQASKATHFSNLYFNENQALLAETLSSLALGGKCFFCNSGAEANEGMVKLARLWGHAEGRYEVISMKNSFHGRTLAMAAATGQEKVKKGFEPMPDGFVHAEFNNLDSVVSLVNEKTVAVMLEAVQGEGGIIPADEEFMQGIRQLCDEQGLLMLCDEVQCGMARTGKWFGFQHYDIEPDAFSLAKSLASGVPIGAVVAGRKLSDVFKPGNHASTFGGNPLACAAALATIKTIQEEGLVEKASTMGDLFREGLETLQEKYGHVKEIRGRGLMIGMVLDQPARPLCDIMAEMGLLALPTAETVVRFLPPLTVTDNELEEALEILDDALAELHGQSNGGESGEEAGPDESEPSEASAGEPAEGGADATAGDDKQS